MMPLNGLIISNLILNDSLVQFILSETTLFDPFDEESVDKAGDVGGGLLDQQPWKYKISI